VRPRLLAGVVAAAGALALAACSGDDSAVTTAPAATTASPSSAAPSTTAAASTTAAPATTDAPTTTSPPTAASTTAAAPTGAEPHVALTQIGTFDGADDLSWRDGDDGLYIVEKGGRIQGVVGDQQTTVLDISDLVSGGGEQGLLGLAFDPAQPLAYVDYTDVNGNTVIAELPVDADGTFHRDQARPVLQIEQPFPNHNGGQLAFGPDGLLYIGMGDGGSGGDPQRRAMNNGELLGKILRVDPHAAGGDPYTVPGDNPFVGVAGARPEVWANGLRNPWRFAFDRQTGDLWIADVGQNAIEEIDVATATDGRDAGKGLNFGWSAFEGNERFNQDVSPDGVTPPFFTYPHGPGCSVSGGLRARGGPVRDLVGWYVYGDYCAGRLWALEVLGEGSSMRPGRQVDLGELAAVTTVVGGPDGEVYALSLQGPVVRLDPA
jgi:glucose/arabinose dehydrogenase